jgi:hypothetical protein
VGRIQLEFPEGRSIQDERKEMRTMAMTIERKMMMMMMMMMGMNGNKHE